MTVAEEKEVLTGIRSIVRSHMLESEEADVDAVVSSVIDELDSDGMRRALRVSLRGIVLSEAHHARRRVAQAPHGAAPKSAKWDRISDNLERIRVFRMWVNPRGAGWMFLGDCTVDQVIALAEDAYARAKDHEDWGARWNALAETMKKKRKKLVSSLEPEQVEDAFHVPD